MQIWNQPASPVCLSQDHTIPPFHIRTYPRWANVRGNSLFTMGMRRKSMVHCARVRPTTCTMDTWKRKQRSSYMPTQRVAVHRRWASSARNTKVLQELNADKNRYSRTPFIQSFIRPCITRRRNRARCGDLPYPKLSSLSIHSLPRFIHALKQRCAG